MNNKMDKRKDFDNILDECLEKVIKGVDINACLAQYPDFAAELEPLLKTAKEARMAAVSVTPRPEFRQRAAAEFQKAIQQMPVKAKEPQGIFKLRMAWLVPVSVVIVLLLAGTGTVAAASGSLPGSPLYNVKLATETVQLALTPSSLGKTELYAKFNDRRVEELVRMADKGMAAEVAAVNTRIEQQMNAMVESTGGGATAADASFEIMSAQEKNLTSPQAASTAPETTASDVTETQVTAPTLTQPPATASRSRPAENETTTVPTITITQPEATTTTLALPAPASLPDVEVAQEGKGNDGIQQTKQEKLQDILTEKQMKNLLKLQKALERAPEDLKPEIQRAIDNILYGYGVSISNLYN